jgi:ribosomal protein S27E
MVATARNFAQAKGFIEPPGYRRHRLESTLLYQLVAEHYPKFRDRRAAEERPLPRYVEHEFEAYLKCGRLEHGFLRVQCESCRAEKLVAFSCKRSGFCPSCGARRMVETAALLVDDVLPRQPVRQWVLSLPFALRYLLATRPEVITQVLGIIYRAISGHLIRKVGLSRASAQGSLHATSRAPIWCSIRPRTRRLRTAGSNVITAPGETSSIYPPASVATHSAGKSEIT